MHDDRSFKIIFRCAVGLIGFVIVAMISFWVLVGYVGYNVVSTTSLNDVAKTAGEAVKSFEKAREK